MDKDTLTLPFDLYTRNHLIMLILNQIRNKDCLKILDVGGRNGRLKKFLTGDEVIIIDRLPIDIDEKYGYLMGDAIHLPFKDVSFDVVVTSDTYEHIPGQLREPFVNELLRVSKNYVILAAPFYSEETSNAELLANQYYLENTGTNHVMLKEHITYNLPTIERLESFLVSKNYEFFKIGTNNISNWLLLQLFNFYCHNHNIPIKARDDVHRYYNENYVELGDLIETTYRKIYLIGKKHTIPNINLKNGKINTFKKQVLIRKIYDAFRDGAESQEQHAKNLEIIINIKEKDISNQIAAINQKDEYIKSMQESLKQKDIDISNQIAAINQKDEYIKSMQESLKQKDIDISNQIAAINQKDEFIKYLEYTINKIESEKNQIRSELEYYKRNPISRLIVNYYCKSKKLIAPNGSRRMNLINFVEKGYKSIRKEGIRKTGLKFINLLIKSINIINLDNISVIKNKQKKKIYLNLRQRPLPALKELSNKIKEYDGQAGKPLSIGKVAFTIVSRNYLPMAFVLAKSFKSYNPTWNFKILLCDMIETREEFEFISRYKDIEVIPLTALHNYIDVDIESMCFKYNVIEMNTAIKPFFMEYLLNYRFDKIIYLDPDILVFKDFDEVDRLLDQYNVILTPHIVEPIPDDGKKPRELDIILSGSYNLGFIAIKNCSESFKLIKWWEERLKDHGFMKIEEGMHVDQKWIELVPSFIEKVYILKKKNYNMAYWNLHERSVTPVNGNYYVMGEPLVFYHFSGFMIDDINKISKHQSRYTLDEFPNLYPIFLLYRQKLLEENISYFKKIKYWYDYLPGTTIKIPEFARNYYNDILSLINNPYNPDAVNTIIRTLNEIIMTEPPITRLWNEIYKQRKDLQAAFPNIAEDKNSRMKFVEWIFNSGIREHSINPVFMQPEGVIPYNKETKFGVNIFGYFDGIFGVAETSRTLYKSFLSMGVPTTLFPVGADLHEKLTDNNITSKTIKKNFSNITPYSINLFVINADQIPHVVKHYGSERLKNKYNIGLCAWELEEYFPFKESFDLLDEIWYFSEFTCKTYRKYTSKPVIKVTYPFIPTWDYLVDKKVIRSRLGIDQNNFVLFYNFDFHSSFERKNPEAVIDAFMGAFPNKDEKANLIFKTIHSEHYPQEVSSFREKIMKDSRIIWIDEPMKKEDLMSLINASDCYISLHRSEGFGLGMAEAMYLGKCVIGTAYGGNMEFMNNKNSILIDYTMTEIKKDYGPYKKGVLWAEPNIDNAIKSIKLLYEDRVLCDKIGKKAAEDIRTNLNPRKTIDEIYKRLFFKNKA